MKPETYLTKEGKAIFSQIAAYLEEKRQVESIDSAFVSACANSCYLMHKYAKVIIEEGAVQEFSTGAQNVTAAYSIFHKERENYARMCKSLGITPEGREKLSAFAAKKQATTSKLRSLMNKKQAK